jgi:hypothetical protein
MTQPGSPDAKAQTTYGKGFSFKMADMNAS